MKASVKDTSTAAKIPELVRRAGKRPVGELGGVRGAKNYWLRVAVRIAGLAVPSGPKMIPL